MKGLFEEYGEVLLQAFISSIIFSLFISFFLVTLLDTNVNILKEDLKPLQLNFDTNLVSIKDFGAYDAAVEVNEEFNYMDNVWASNTNDEDIKSYISILNYDVLDTSKEGEKDITYVLRYNGESRAIKAKLIVLAKGEEA